jgi:hypothetical protein
MTGYEELRKSWYALFEHIAGTGNSVLDRSDLCDQEVAEGLRQKLRLALLSLNWRIENNNSEFPVFQRMNDHRAGGSSANSDITYLRAQVHGDQTYRVHGEPGSREFCIYAARGDFSILEEDTYLGERWSHELDRSRDGSVDVIIGGPERGRNWLPLYPGEPCWLAIRQYFRDWQDADIPGFFSIDCLDGSAMPTPLSTSELTARLGDALRWLTRAGPAWTDTMRPRPDCAPPSVNKLERPVSTKNSSSRVGYGRCPYELSADEVLVIEMPALPRPDWNVGVFNVWCDVGDIQNRQTSLNASQAHVDSDGVLRLVLSEQDIGHPNWLDTAGNRRGQIWFRTFDQETSVATPVSRVLPVDKVWQQLPKDTPRVDPTERLVRLLQRRHHVARRYER